LFARSLRRARGTTPRPTPSRGRGSRAPQARQTAFFSSASAAARAAASAAAAAEAAAQQRAAADAEERRSLRNRVVGLGVRLYAQVGRSVAAGGLELIDSQSQSQPRGRMDMAS